MNDDPSRVRMSLLDNDESSQLSTITTSSTAIPGIESSSGEGSQLMQPLIDGKLSVTIKSTPEAQQTTRTATIASCIAALLGAEILGIPNAFISSGVILSSILLLVVNLISICMCWLVVRLEIETNSTGFSDLTKNVLGKLGYSIFNVLSIGFVYALVTSYLIIAGDSIVSFFALAKVDVTKNKWYRTLIEFVYSAFIPIAMTIPKNHHFLSYTSLVSTGCIIFFIVSLCIKGIMGLVKNGPSPTIVVKPRISVATISDFAIYALTFSLPALILPIIATYTKIVSKRQSVATISLLVGFVVVFLTGLFGYLLYGKDTGENVLNSFPDTDILITIVRAAFFFITSFGYPLVIQSVMCNWSTILFHEGDQSALPTKKRLFVLFISNILPLLLAMFVANIKPVLSIGGGLGGLIVDFCYPTVMWVVHTKQKWPHWQHILCIILALFGLILGIAATVISIINF